MGLFFFSPLWYTKNKVSIMNATCCRKERYLDSTLSKADLFEYFSKYKNMMMSRLVPKDFLSHIN